MLYFRVSGRCSANFYTMRVSVCHRSRKAKVGKALLIVLFVGLFSSSGAEKKIMLRNEVIATAVPQRQSLRSQAVAAPVSGLYLIQLEDDPPQDWREQLAKSNVKALRAVPQDAYVARFSRTSISQVGGLPFVRYVGAYKPEHKILPSLASLAGSKTNLLLSVRVLLPADSNPIETIKVQRSFRFLSKYDKSRFGKVLEGSISSDHLASLMQSDAVLWIEPAAK